MDGLRDGGDGGDAGVVGEGVGDGDDFGEDGGVLLDELGEFIEVHFEDVGRERLDEGQQLGEAGGGAGAEDRVGTVDRLLGGEWSHNALPSSRGGGS